MVSSNSYGTVTKSISITATSGGASGNVLYTCPNNFDAEVTFLHITNGASSTDTVSVQWYHLEDNAYYTILNSKQIAGNDTYDIIQGGNSFYMHSGDKIVAFNGGGTLNITLSAKEYYNPVR